MKKNEKFIKIKYSSVSNHLLFSYLTYLKLIFIKFNISYKLISLPKKKKKKTFLKSPHVNKKAKENFNFILYSSNLYISFNLHLLKILRYNLPKNIFFKIYYCY